MKNFFKIVIVILALLLFPVLSFAQQNVLVQTTLSAAVSAPVSGGTTSLVQIASATGITAGLNPTTTINSQNFWILFVDREAMAVVGVNGTALQVIRGYNSTVASAHVSGQMVLYGRQQWFYVNDPGATPGADGGVSGVGCTTASVLVSPWLNIRNGAQWLCSSITKTWVPGFGNPGQKVNTALVADAAGLITPSGPLFQVGAGTNAVTGFNIPVGCNATAYGGCEFTVIPTSAWTWTTATNIATAGTAVANLAITFRWDAKQSLFIVMQSK